MSWTPPEPPDWVARLNAHGEAAGGPAALVSLDADELLSCAQATTGLDDFGADSWRPHFATLVAALDDEAHLTALGRLVARAELLRALRQRLLLQAAWRADPGILDEVIDAPVFVVGTGRSGTSILHELLALDPDNRTPATWELLHPGEPGARRVGHDVHSSWADLQPAYDTMHHNHGDEPNECILATALEFLSDQWSGTYEIPTYSAYALGQDHTEAYRYHRRVLQTLQHRRRAVRWVLKAPSHLSQLRTLFAVYPDARVVQIHRDPLCTVPSTISLMATIRSMRCARVDVEGLAELVSLGYALMLEDTMDARRHGELPDRQFVDVRFADLMADPIGALTTTYEALGLPWPDGMADAVGAHLAARPRGGRGEHRYSLADTGLDVVTERARFARYQARFGVPDEV